MASWIRNGSWNVDFEMKGYEPKNVSVKISEITRNPEVESTLRKIKGLMITEGLEKELGEGNQLYEEGKYEEAAAAHSEILEGINIYNSDTGLLNALGYSFYKTDQKDRALVALRMSLRLNPDTQDIKALVAEIENSR